MLSIETGIFRELRPYVLFGRAEDNFNLYGLRSIIPNFRACLNVILDVSDSTHLDSDQDLDACVMDLYGLIHARYIITKRGMDRMVRWFLFWII